MRRQTEVDGVRVSGVRSTRRELGRGWARLVVFEGCLRVLRLVGIALPTRHSVVRMNGFVLARP